ncbi:hypothetical protein LUZ61_011746 [Rhynchospora tenuis]|uniref:Dirigent protein n=1 Tax=Rhynchospora tenuis TaxID=198213 RepID=A0AAD6F0J7_9POAL|nr:hypothetical protein LUZ61_011746 [Rhynchospora tenuis]
MEPGVIKIRTLKNNIQGSFYFYQQVSGSNANQSVLLSGKIGSFGTFVANDWVLADSLASDRKVIGRVQGLHLQESLQAAFNYYEVGNFVFQDGSFKGSTLNVMGNHHSEANNDTWSIVGGTGQFERAQGTVKKTKVQNANGLYIGKLEIDATCTLPKTPST